MEIQHFSHEHVLSYCEDPKQKLKETSNKVEDIKEMNEQEPVVEMEAPTCPGCYQYIDGPSYFCETCQSFWLCNSCALLPQELPVHLYCSHPLKLASQTHPEMQDSDIHRRPLEFLICYQCRDAFSGFAYHCTECHIVLDLKCALSANSESPRPRSPEDNEKIEHFSHDHKLYLFNATEELEPKLLRCKIGCGIPLSGLCYGCFGCEFYLHRNCAGIPEKVTIESPFHTPHPLTFQYDKYLEYICEECRLVIWCGFVFRCEECDFKLHARCALLSLAEGQSSRRVEVANKLYHFSHLHELSFFNSTKGLYYDCDGCSKSLIGEAYGCLSCEFYIHKSCADMPLEIKHHPYHPLHPLHAQIAKARCCDGCQMQIKGITYRCFDCDFDLHILCAMNSLALKSALKHRCHEHNLYYFLASGSTGTFECIICGDVCVGSFYVCLECRCYFHLGCIPIPRTIKHDCHMHSLTLMDSVVENDSGQYYCHACETERSSKYQYYTCEQCPFTAHIECVASEFIEGESSWMVIEEAEYNEEQKADTDYPTFAKSEIPHCKKQIDIKDFGTDHTLIFHESIIDKNCYGCKAIIPNSGYACESCKTCLHKECAELPLKIHHPLHSLHPLTLFSPDGDRHFVCDGCVAFCEGNAGYQCQKCRFVLDINCASVCSTTNPSQSSKETTLAHFSHVHKLTLAAFAEQHEVVCNICGLSILGLAYCCLECKFFLHESCSYIPQDIEHPFHSQHLLKFSELFPFDPCYACGFITKSTYHCEECRFMVHTTCANYLTSALRHNFHEHNLFYFRKHDLSASGFIQSRGIDNSGQVFRCEVCGSDCDSSFYRCLDCFLNVHLECIPIPGKVKGQCHIHALTLENSIIDNGRDEYYCHACENPRNSTHAFYYCQRCSFTAHIGCVLDEEDSSLEILSSSTPVLEKTGDLPSRYGEICGEVPCQTTLTNNSIQDTYMGDQIEDIKHLRLQ